MVKIMRPAKANKKSTKNPTALQEFSQFAERACGCKARSRGAWDSGHMGRRSVEFFPRLLDCWATDGASAEPAGFPQGIQLGGKLRLLDFLGTCGDH